MILNELKVQGVRCKVYGKGAVRNKVARRAKNETIDLYAQFELLRAFVPTAQ